MTPAQACPCGSSQTASNCCMPIIEGKRKPATATDLLRARYSAFALGRVDFVLETHHSRTRHEVKREEIEDWSKGSEWLGLSVHETEAGGENDEKGTIVFCAEYKADGKIVKHWEQSLFEKENGAWRFVDARGVKNEPIRRDGPKAGRNDPCPCGSGQKYKKCCGK